MVKMGTFGPHAAASIEMITLPYGSSRACAKVPLGRCPIVAGSDCPAAVTGYRNCLY